MTYDVENRMGSATSSSGTEYYAYGPSNERVWKRIEYSGGGSTNFVYFYGVDGALLTTGGIDDDWDYNVYFAGRQVWREKTGFSSQMPAMAVSPDRLGSTVKHFPYGDEPTTTTQDRVKFATYYRDEATVLDYARNRYYSSTIARFTTADPYQASGGPADPQSWNRYAYVQGDPVNFNDPEGLAKCPDGYSRGWWNGGDTPCYPKTWFYDTQVPNTGSRERHVISIMEVATPTTAVAERFSGIPKGVAEAMTIAFEALKKPECAALFNTDPNRAHGYSAHDVLLNMVTGLSLGGVSFGSVITGRIGLGDNAVTVGADRVFDGGEGRASSADIVLQSNPLGAGYWWDRTPDQLARTLIHELGHVFNLVVGLGGSAIQYDLNDPEAQKANETKLQKCLP